MKTTHEIMTKEVVSIRAERSVAEAYVVAESTPLNRVAEEMLTQKVSAFLVKDLAGHLKGIVTTDDLLRLFVENSREEISAPLKNIVRYFAGPEVA